MARRKIATVESGPVKALVQRDSEWQEYRVRLYVANTLQVNADYHTDDKEDAVSTAHAMVRFAQAKLEAQQ